MTQAADPAWSVIEALAICGTTISLQSAAQVFRLTWRGVRFRRFRQEQIAGGARYLVNEGLDISSCLGQTSAWQTARRELRRLTISKGLRRNP